MTPGSTDKKTRGAPAPRANEGTDQIPTAARYAASTPGATTRTTSDISPTGSSLSEYCNV